MKLLSDGRASYVFDLGDGRVLRRFKDGGDTMREAHWMEVARAHGYPVPAVLDVSRDELVMEHIEGVPLGQKLQGADANMLADAARVLSELHRKLHTIQIEGKGVLLHLDLHPWNIIDSGADGPFVVDWTNARPGKSELDLSLTYVILATGGPGPRKLAELFAAMADVATGLVDAVEYRLADPHVRATERRAASALLRRRGRAR